MQRVYFLGKLSGATRREAAEVVRLAGGHVNSRLNESVDLIVVGEENILKQDWNLWNDQLDADTRRAFENGTLSIISETQFWERFDPQQRGSAAGLAADSLYTPSMLSKLTGVPVPLLRRLQKERLIQSLRQVYRLPYFGK